MKVAETALSWLRRLPSLHWRVEEAELFWARGELETAKRMMKMLIDDMETVRYDCVCVKCVTCFTYWTILDRISHYYNSFSALTFLRKGSGL